uniref:Palmitoyltransferase n=1 Tax=Crassostrea virginica TaxID=6565 RepID=A0A8B8ENS3_CRAVI|nr:palmitoyltransferase ZDHHC22-like [Crassostrea virginica]XP_022341586.1 palmitoyltransferase ZDHHC22-like [Crassostrea virginica]
MMNFFVKFLEFTQGVGLTLDNNQEGPPNHRPVLAKNLLVLLNYAGMCYVIVFTSLLHWVASSVCLPGIFHNELQDPEFSFFYHHLFFWYLTINAFGQWLCTILTSIKSVYSTASDLPMFNDSTHQDWVKCTKCDQNVPPRARHCNICERCILKRDHHCLFTGCCVGFHNQRHFILWSFYGIVGTTVALYYLEKYLTIHYVSFLGTEFFKYFLPYALVITIIGKSSFYTFLAIFWFYLTLSTGLFCVYIFFWQMNLIRNGQTSYEFVKGQKIYQSSFWDQMRSVFGPYWVIQFLFPLPWVKQEGDGVTWNYHNTKFM